MTIVDSHTHVVSPDRERYPLDPRDLSGDWYEVGPASADDLARLMGDSGVDRAVLVQGVGAYTWRNDYAADAAAADPGRFVSACAIDVLAADAVETLREWIRGRGMQGVRLFALSREGPSWLAQDVARPVWKEALALEARIIVTILPPQLGELESVLTTYPDARVSLDHCAFALGDDTTRRRLFELASHPGLMLKVSTHNLDEAVEREGSARPMMAGLVEAFGADRLMWGSDFCQTHDRPYAALVDLARDACADLRTTDREAVLGETAHALWFGEG